MLMWVDGVVTKELMLATPIRDYELNKVTIIIKRIELIGKDSTISLRL